MFILRGGSIVDVLRPNLKVLRTVIVFLYILLFCKSRRSEDSVPSDSLQNRGSARRVVVDRRVASCVPQHQTSSSSHTHCYYLVVLVVSRQSALYCFIRFKNVVEVQNDFSTLLLNSIPSRHAAVNFLLYSCFLHLPDIVSVQNVLIRKVSKTKSWYQAYLLQEQLLACVSSK